MKMIFLTPAAYALVNMLRVPFTATSSKFLQPKLLHGDNLNARLLQRDCYKKGLAMPHGQQHKHLNHRRK